MAEQFIEFLKVSLAQRSGLAHHFTKTIHQTSYPAIEPTRPELSQEGRNVLITGGGTGIGLAIAKAFTQAGAETVIIVGRRAHVLASASEEIDEVAKKAGKQTQVIVQTCDVTDKAGVASLWAGLKEKKIEVDVLVLNSAKFQVTPQSVLEIGSDEAWAFFEGNVHGPLMFAEAFSKQNGDKPKSLVNVATQSIHELDKEKNPLQVSLPLYGLSKNAGTLTIQQIAVHADPDKLQVVSFHPGLIYSEVWKGSGITEDVLPFDDLSLAGHEAVWLASPEARFLHGRFVWASWDVDELKSGEVRKRIDEDSELLRIGVHGLNGLGDSK